MAAPPVLPDDFKAVIPAANSSLCQKLVSALIKFPTLVYQLVSWMFNADGTVSDNFRASIGASVGGLSVPNGVSASDGTFTDHVVITWNPVNGATAYEVWRGTTSDPTTATKIAQAQTTTYTDTSMTIDQVFYYFIKSINAIDAPSGFSVGDSGFTSSTGPATPRVFTGSGTYTVPIGVTALTIEAWGAGGGGGYSACPFCPVGTPFFGGGGGGSGEYLKVITLTVTPGESLDATVGAAGSAGGGPGAGGGSGGDTIISRAGVALVTANGGLGGVAGATGASNGAGGAGGNGGSNSSGTLDTQTAGSVGGSGSSGVTPVAGTGATENTGGGNGGGNGGANSPGTAGSSGRLKVTPE